jgi:hypothetical protein
MIQQLSNYQRNTQPRSQQTEPSLSAEAVSNMAVIREEFRTRFDTGLANNGSRLETKAEIERFLGALRQNFPSEYLLAKELALQTAAWTAVPQLVVTIPIAGFGNQEQPAIIRTIELLSKEAVFKDGRARLVIFANRPENIEPDNTARFIQLACQQYGMESCTDLVEAAVPANFGRRDSPLLNGHSLGSNKPPMGLIRDLLSMTSMIKMQSCIEYGVNPVQLQMDADFEGFGRGNLTTLMNYFQTNPSLDFVQCTSDWESRHSPTRNDALFQLGCDLMRELPMGIKEYLNSPHATPKIVAQTLFGELIQRGIQVPQAETFASIAYKGGYGLLRLPEDELDANVRSAYRGIPGTIRNASDVVFLWNARRALAVWHERKLPPISQWSGADFQAIDPVRASSAPNRSTAQLSSGLSGSSGISTNGTQQLPSADALDVINKTLARIPIPHLLDSPNGDGAENYVWNALSRCGIQQQSGLVLRRTSQNNDCSILQLSLG